MRLTMLPAPATTASSHWAAFSQKSNISQQGRVTPQIAHADSHDTLSWHILTDTCVRVHCCCRRLKHGCACCKVLQLTFRVWSVPPCTRLNFQTSLCARSCQSHEAGPSAFATAPGSVCNRVANLCAMSAQSQQDGCLLRWPFSRVHVNCSRTSRRGGPQKGSPAQTTRAVLCEGSRLPARA